jgi:hydrogenase nickel incorporation protein HypA/HybF
VHELSIALSIVEGAEEEVARQGGGRVSAVFLRLGPLSGVVADALLFSYPMACAGTVLENSELRIEEIPVRIYCEACDRDGEPKDYRILRCPFCDAPSGRVLQGNELELTALELMEWSCSVDSIATS